MISKKGVMFTDHVMNYDWIAAGEYPLAYPKHIEYPKC